MATVLRRCGKPWLAAAACLILTPTLATASGYAIREQSSSFQGLSFAGVAAGGRDISPMYFNPATLGLHEGQQVHVGASYILPSARFKDGSGTMPFTGAPLGGPLGGDVADDAVVPSVYGMVSAGNWRFGVGVTAPFGLRTEQPKDWIGRYHATESELVTINVNPVVAYRFDERLTVALGFVAQYADATLGNAVRVPGVPADFQSKITGSDWDFGYTLGVLTEPLPGTRLGLGYRSQINHSLTGTRRVTSPPGVPTPAVTGGRAALQTPQIASLGLRQELGERWSVLGTVEWTGWSTFERLVITFEDGSPANITEQNWRDTWFFALGGEYRPRPDLALQASVAYDQSPNRDGFRTPRIPDADRTWLSVGLDWAPRDWLRLGGAYSRIFVADGRIDLQDTQRGDLQGRFENGVDILTLHATLRF